MKLEAIAREQKALRAQAETRGLCWYCNGQGAVFGGVPGRPTLTDPENICECPRCEGTGKRAAKQMELI